MKYNLKPDERATLELRGLYEKYGYRKYKIGKFGVAVLIDALLRYIERIIKKSGGIYVAWSF